MPVFMYMFSYEPILESVVGKLNNIVIKERELFLKFIFFYFNNKTL